MPDRTSSLQAIAEHQLEWNDRLQDWLDGDIEDVDGVSVEAHLPGCGICQQQLAALAALDKELLSATPAPGLSAGFDQRLFAQIDAIDETQRAAARRRAEQELQENLRALSRGWRRTLAFIIPGVAGGITLALALASYLDSSGVAGQIAAEGAQLGGNATTIQTLLIAVMGAGIGGLMAGWMAGIDRA